MPGKQPLVRSRRLQLKTGSVYHVTVRGGLPIHLSALVSAIHATAILKRLEADCSSLRQRSFQPATSVMKPLFTQLRE